MNNLPIQTYESVVQQRDALEKKLLAYEQADKNPVAFVDERSAVSGGICWTKSGKRELPHGTELYAAPVLPKQPELPQGFTYESGILTANFGNGDVLISDTHWPESGHAGISFAPVPQPKRPNLSDYTDLLGGSKTEEIGTLFIVKSNNAESLIAIRNKLDIAINALSPAPAQPVIPEQIEPAAWRCDKEGTKGVVITVHKKVADSWILKGWKVTPLIEANQSQPVSEPYKLKDAVEDIRNSEVEIDADKIKAERDTLNSPVIPDGWKLVPIEPTENMIIEGFESEPNKTFSKPEVWQEYAAMSGCKQAAHRAKLCWAAMLAAAPTAQESE